MNTCSACGNSALWEMHMNGTASCRNCGILVHNELFVDPGADNFMHSFQSMSVLHQTQTYTRAKRFKKYLNRACMRQSVNSGPPSILRRLKQAGRKLRNKCYDCLPLLVHHLCDVRVPVLCDREITVAAEMFKVIDAAFPKDGGFMSYAYALEFVLVRMDRADMLPYLSGIQCSKRRAHYHEKLTRIFRDASSGEIQQASGSMLPGSCSSALPVASGTTAALEQIQPPGGSIYQLLLAGRAQCKSD